MEQSVKRSSDAGAYPIDLYVSIGSLDYMHFSFDVSLRLNDEKLEGTVSYRGSSFRNCMDDEDADQYAIEAEKETVDAVKDFLRSQGIKKPGVINSTWTTLFYDQRKYEF